ncbi:MAG: hypothetical protein ABW088_00185 [Sedimenticola sp.]
MNTDTSLTPDERQERLWLLFDTLLDHFIESLEKATPGELRASLLAVIRDFLKDNQIDSKHIGRRVMLTGLTQLKQDMQFPFDS